MQEIVRSYDEIVPYKEHNFIHIKDLFSNNFWKRNLVFRVHTSPAVSSGVEKEKATKQQNSRQNSSLQNIKGSL